MPFQAPMANPPVSSTVTLSNYSVNDTGVGSSRHVGTKSQVPYLRTRNQARKQLVLVLPLIMPSGFFTITACAHGAPAAAAVAAVVEEEPIAIGSFAFPDFLEFRRSQ